MKRLFAILFFIFLVVPAWGATYYIATDGTGITADYNVHYRSEATSVFRIDTPEVVTYTLAQWKEANYEGDNSVYSDPLLSTYTPASNSPAVNEGANLSILVDYYGRARPWGGGFDIGAVEFNASPVGPWFFDFF